MSLVRINIKGEVTLPSLVRKRAGVDVGDLLEVKLESGKITLTPASLVEQRLNEGLDDIKNGRTYGPFDSADELIESLEDSLKKRASQRKPTFTGS